MQKAKDVNFSKKFNFLKACAVKTALEENPFSNSFQNDNYSITKRLQPDPLIKREVNDLCKKKKYLDDKTILFLAP